MKQQKLEIYQSTWAMEVRQPNKPEWSFQEKCDLAADAGYAGLNIDLDVEDMPELTHVRNSLRTCNLDCSIVSFPANTTDLNESLAKCALLEADHLVVNARYFPFDVNEAVPFVESFLESSVKWDIPVFFETHRLTLTNDLLFTTQLLDVCPELKLIADVSHYVVGREMPMPVDSFHDELIRRILESSAGLQGRVASREQIQVPLAFPQHENWVLQFQNWWSFAIESWKKRSADDACLNFTCELGPAPYAMTDSDGFELSDRWLEALELRAMIEKIWAKLDS